MDNLNDNFPEAVSRVIENLEKSAEIFEAILENSPNVLAERDAALILVHLDFLVNNYRSLLGSEGQNG